MPITTVAALVQLLEQYGVVEPEHRAQVAELARSGPKDPRGFARELLQHGWLTPYQVNQLFQDNGVSLLLGSYVVLERLGSGGMGNVFKARHQKLGRVVAVKFIHRNKLDNPSVVKRFHREIQIAAKLDHPNIVHAFDAEDVSGAQVLVMEYLEGIDLGKLVKESGPLPVPAACDYIRQAALGLQHAHEIGLVHRDIKPSNLMLVGSAGQSGGGGVIKLLDLGLALLQQPLVDGSVSGPLTVAGKVVGTVDFIAPEQARDASTVDIRADLYGLGCTFYYLLAGRAPFDGATVTNKLFKHALEEPEALEGLRRDVPPAVSAIIRRLMAKKPEDRFQTPAEVAAALEQVLQVRSARAVAPSTDAAVTKDRPAPAPPPDPRPEARKPARRAARTAEAAARVVAVPVATVATSRRTMGAERRRWLLLNLAGLAVLVLMIGVLALVLRNVLGSENESSARESNRLSPAEREALAELDALRRRHQDGVEDKKAIRQDLLTFRWRRAGLPQVVQAAAILHDLPSPLDALNPAKIPAGRQFEGQPPELVAIVPTPAATALVAPDDSRALTLSAGRPTQVLYVDLVTGQPGRRFERVPGDVAVLTLAPDGKKSLLAGRGKYLAVWDAFTGREDRKLDGHAGPVTAAALSPTGRWAISGGQDKSVRLWDLGDGSMHVLEGHAAGVAAVAFTPDGKQALSAGADKTVRLWEVDIHRERKPPAEAPGPVRCLVVAPDGKHVYSAGTKGVQRWSLGPLAADGSLEGYEGAASALALTADGHYLAAASQESKWVGIWDLGSGQKVRDWTLPAALGLSWALDSRHLAVAGGPGGIYVLRLP